MYYHDSCSRKMVTFEHKLNKEIEVVRGKSPE
jgi:hypothetical protein